MGGFIGSTADGITTTLGRGGSDFTAALVGGGLHAGAIEIWTDVNGIMTTDPRICPDALRVKTISFEEAAELAYFGAKVLHPATILPAVQKSIPVWVLNSRNAENEGTKITAMAPPCASPFKSIAAKKRLTIIDVVASRMLMSHGYLKAVFDVFDKYHCAIDMVSTSEVSISVTVDSNERLPEICAELGKIADVKLEGHKALICMVGEDIRGRERNLGAGVFGDPACECADDLAGRERDQHELHDRGVGRGRGGPVVACGVLCGSGSRPCSIPKPGWLRLRPERGLSELLSRPLSKSGMRLRIASRSARFIGPEVTM